MPTPHGSGRPRDRLPERELSVLYDVFVVSGRLSGFLERALAPSGLRPSEYAVYSILSEVGTTTPSELETMTGSPHSTLTTYLGHMVRRGHLRRERNPRDGRSVRLTLTDDGYAAQRRAAPMFDAALDRLKAELAMPVDELRGALLTLDDALRALDTADATADVLDAGA